MLDPNTTAKIGLAAWELRDRLKTATQKMRRRLSDGKLGIAIFGAGGTGKSTLGHVLDENFDPTAPPKEYISSINIEQFWLKSNDAQSVFVAPGQRDRKGHWHKLLNDIFQKKQLLIINIVAAGYHSTENKITDIDSYLLQCVQEEQALLQDLINSIQIIQKPLKMITVVAKQDLWCEDQSEIAGFYEKGNYARTISEIQAIKGTENFQHEFVYASLTIQSLRDKTDKKIILNTAGYDLIEHIKSLNQLIETIEKLSQ
jgi:hypothetical protein